MTPFEHAVLSVRDFGGTTSDYLKLHEYLDQTKFMLPDWRHRMFLHNTLGITLCEQQFGASITNSNNVEISVREIARKHITQDLNGKVPTLQEWVDGLTNNKTESWMNKPYQPDLDWLTKNHYKNER